jgi:hypothetical protein
MTTARRQVKGKGEGKGKGGNIKRKEAAQGLTPVARRKKGKAGVQRKEPSTKGATIFAPSTSQYNFN